MKKKKKKGLTEAIFNIVCKEFKKLAENYFDNLIIVKMMILGTYPMRMVFNKDLSGLITF